MTHIEFHTHTVYSHDAFITFKQLDGFFSRNPDFVIAVTDHNEIRGALQARKQFGKRIIVGEEVKTRQGEIIGLYLSEYLEPGLDLEITLESVKQQGGLVLVPHPFKRHGKSDSPLKEEYLYNFVSKFDIIEVFNARNRTPGANARAQKFADRFDKPQSVGSDAHAVYELGHTYVTIPEYKGKETLLDQLRLSTQKRRSISVVHRIFTRIQRELRRGK